MQSSNLFAVDCGHLVKGTFRMDLFGRKRKLATKAALDFLRPLFGILQHFYGLPSRLWQDEFVVGFAGGIRI